MEKLFKLKQHNTNIKTEILAGITTFLTMAYILAVNPLFLSGIMMGGSTGMDINALFTATAVAAIIGTLCMAFFANYPIALASGMGLNAFFASIVLGGISWQIVLTAILLEGLVFILLSLFKFRESIVNAIPKNLKLAITAGIGLFIAVIGLGSAGISMGANLTSPVVILSVVGVLVIGTLVHFKVKGAILWGILITYALGIGAQAIGWYVPNPDMGLFSLYPSGIFSMPPSLKPLFFKFDFSGAWKLGLDFAVIVFAFLMVDMFDTIGTLVGVASQADLLDEDGNLPRAKGALLADAVGTTAGAVLGTSTVTSYIESAAGVGEGGRTGLTSVSTAVMFGIALFFSPLFLAIPAFATAPALIIVGLMMMKSIKNIDFTDYTEAIPAFLAIIVMPIASSIADGIMFAFISWTILKLVTGQAKKIHWVMYVVSALFILKLILL
ncbi:MAG: NCS2 family permease [Clostridiales bacterium]|nr:NCS2 family permease [Clostridiales bacterium]